MLSPKKLSETFNDHHVSRLDLGQDPFDRNYNSNSFYHGGERRKVLEQLVHYGRYSKQPVLLTGDVGSGKDRILTEIIDQLQAVMDCCRVSVELLSNPSAILSAIAERLSLKLDANNSLQSFIEALKFTLSDDEEVEPLFIVVEKVQLLSADDLEFLFDLQRSGHGGIHMLMVSDELTATLEVFCGEGRQALKAIKLRPLNQQETIEFVIALLHGVGYAGDMPLTKEQWQELYEKSQGNFYAIKEWMPEILMEGVSSSVKNRSLGIPITHILAISILAASITIAYFYQDNNIDVVNSAAGQEKQQDKKKELTNQKNLKVTAVDEVEKVVTKRKERDPAGREKAAQSDLVTKVEKIIASPNVIEKISKRTDGAQVDKEIKSAESAIGLMKVELKNSLANNGKGKEIVPVIPLNTKNISVYSKQEQRIMNLPRNAYMLQVLGARKEESAVALVKKYTNRLPVTYFETVLKNKPWFVVLLGPYDNRDKALSAVQQLPQALQKQKPWARSVSGIQAEILK
ncbi:MAG: septal ring-binding cell division protein DamX/type II secretory pathway predicted ATPase ExeA [Pseudohongiellaceae bacterium]|jgi:septal ring-binding cell division protein DamX/type II secretory pathway predicted ATPase ExeA